MNDVLYADEKYKKVDVVGEKVLIRKMKNWNDIFDYDGVFIVGSQKDKNTIMGCGQVLDVTPETTEKYGVQKGDYVLYDYWSAFGDYKDSIITNAENLIVKITKEEAESMSKTL